jgi:hypothetical protein
MASTRNYHAEYLARKTRGAHPAEISKFGTTSFKRSGVGAKRGVWSHRKIKKSDIKKNKRRKYQMHMWADYKDEKTLEVKKNFSSWSRAHKTLEMEIMMQECIAEAQSNLGGSNWVKIKTKAVKYEEWIQRGKIIQG